MDVAGRYNELSDWDACGLAGLKLRPAPGFFANIAKRTWQISRSFRLSSLFHHFPRTWNSIDIWIYSLITGKMWPGDMAGTLQQTARPKFWCWPRWPSARQPRVWLGIFGRGWD